MSTPAGSMPIEFAGGTASFAGKALPLSGPDVALLELLVRNTGGLVAEDVLLASAPCAWVAGPAVALARIGALNKVLHAHCGAPCYVMHLPGAGYGLALPGTKPVRQRPADDEDRATAPLPRLRTRLIGRQEALARLVENASRSSLVTVFGPGGIGKTALALAAGHRLAAAFEDGVVFADLSTLTDATAVPPSVAAALGVPASGAMTAEGVANFLARREVLLILDNCEHVVDAVAALCEAIHRVARRTHVLATSREVLRCTDETVHRVHSLQVPAESAAGTAGAALGFAAVQLLVERITERKTDFVLADADAPLAAALCRRVDGLPLAIELVAGFAKQLDLPRMLALLDAPLEVGDSNPVRAAVRHESLGHLLSWSYELLGRPERRVFERLALFRGHFTADSAGAAAGGDGVDPAHVPRVLMALTSKSLLVAEPGEDGARFRFLETTRDFALAKLRASGEFDAAAARHALHVCDLLEEAERIWLRLWHSHWRVRHGALVDDLRAALAWCFSAQGDPALGVRLAVAGTPVVFHLDLWTEFASWYGMAVDALDAGCKVEPALQVRLRTAYGSVLMFAEGRTHGVRESYGAAWQVARDAASRLEAGALDGVWMGAFAEGDYPVSIVLAARCAELARASGDAIAITRTTRMHAQALHAVARHAEAAALAQSLVDDTANVPRAAHECSIDPQISGRVVLARIHWLQGRANDARTVLDEALALCGADQKNSPVMHVLAWGLLPVSLWRGDLDAAEDFLEQLTRQCEVFRQPFWTLWVRPYELAIDSARGRTVSLEGWAQGAGTKQQDMLATVMRHAVPDRVLARAESGMAPWCAPEVLRARGEQMLRQDPAALPAAEQMMRRGFALAREQGALAWELRCATSLARVWRHRGMTIEAVELLSGVYARFAQGHETADLLAARRLLDQISGRAPGRPNQPTARPA